MGYFVIVACIILWNIMLSELLKKEYIKVLPISLMVAPLIVYIFGFINHFSYGIYFLGIITIIFYIYKIYQSIKTKQIQFNKNNILNIGTLLSIIVYIYIAYASGNKGFNTWDDYMHWGSMVKYNLEFDSFYCFDSNYIFAHKDYPPIISIYNMIFCFINGGYTEGCCIVAVQYLQLSFLMSLLSNLTLNIKDTFKGIILTIIIILSAIVLPEVGNFFYSSTYTDALIGIMFGYGLYMVMEDDNFNLITIIILGSFILLLKQIGLAFYALIIFAYLLKLIINSIKQKKINKNTIIKLLSLIIIPFIFYLSWSLLINNMNANNTLVNQFSYSDLRIWDIFGIIKQTSGEVWQIETVKQFIQAIQTRSMFYQPFQLSYIESIILIEIIYFITVFLHKNHNKINDEIIKGIVYGLGAVGYAIGMLLLYVFAFGPYEGPILASFERYMSSYIFAGIVLVFMEWTLNEEKYLDKYKIYLLLLGTIIFVPINDYHKILPIRNYYSWGDGLKNYTDSLKTVVNEDETMLIIEDNMDTINHYIMGYQIMPMTIDVIDYGYDEVKGDQYCMIPTDEELIEKISNNDYLYVYNLNPELKKQINKLYNIEVEEYSLYEVNNHKLEKVNY